tara:strand:- start:1442 stop:1615 length:174 start_codon:yes stop_codon:yes gene_type:complete
MDDRIPKFRARRIQIKAMEKLTNLTGADMKKSENGEIKFEVNPRPVIVTAPTTIVAY